MSADYVGQQRQLGKNVHEIMSERLGRFDRFHELLAAQATAKLNVLSYRSYVYHRPCGANWLIVGEAATLVDPLTANGVTAALRHGGEGAQFILKSWKRGQLTRRQKAVYTANLTGMGHFFNHSIEASIYEWPVRRGLGLIRAVNIYTAFAYTLNAVYSRLKPITPASAWAFGLIFSGVWLRVEAWAALGRLICGTRWLCSIVTRKSDRSLSARDDRVCRGVPKMEAQADPAVKITLPSGGVKS
jgi:menaquinone-9 beta-reductase